VVHGVFLNFVSKNLSGKTRNDSTEGNFKKREPICSLFTKTLTNTKINKDVTWR